jgi:hypothetical protein
VDLSNLDNVTTNIIENLKVPTVDMPKNNILSIDGTSLPVSFKHSAEYVFHIFKMKKLALNMWINDNTSNVLVNKVVNFKIVIK